MGHAVLFAKVGLDIEKFVKTYARITAILYNAMFVNFFVTFEVICRRTYVIGSGCFCLSVVMVILG